MRDQIERTLEILKMRVVDERNEEICDILMELDVELFNAVGKAIVKEKNDVLEGCMMRVSVMRAEKEMQKGFALLNKFLALQSDEERTVFVEGLGEENRMLLERTYWSQKTSSAAFAHLLKKAIRPGGKRALASVVTGGLCGTGAVIAGSSTGTVIATALGSALMADVVITGLEEDQATRRMGQGLRRVLLEKPKSFFRNLFAKEEKEVADPATVE